MTQPYDYGETVTLRAEFPAVPSTIVLLVSKPDGTIVTPSPSIDSNDAPIYRANVIANMVGTWGYRFEGGGLQTGIEEGYFTVIASAVLTGVPDYTYDLSNDIGQLRLLTDDRDLTSVANATPLEQRSAIFSDAEMQVFLDQAAGNVYMAASKVLTTIAGNRGLMVQSRRIGRTEVSYGGIRSDLLRQAEAFRDQAYADAPATAYAEIAWDDFSSRQIIYNDVRRHQS